ncbi:EamA family transporter [Actinoplanes sp. RD1]|uniref:EamA family transporter n=1 Tax=Actinoplanes sp. RD1 TaxID=3064538 RepID=UPI002740DFAA|nr:EamA family transporter [Actinoplanes sp. RD1]
MTWELGVAGLAALAWGGSDFLAGLGARRVSVRTVLIGSKATGAVLAVLYLLARPGPLPHDARTILVAAAAGLVGVPAMALFYLAMRDGPLAIVTPVAAGAALVPVAWGFGHGEHLDALGVAGAVTALAGITLASLPATSTRPRAAATFRATLCAAGAALGFGAYFVLLHEAAPQDPYGATACARITGGLVILLFVLLRPAPARPVPADRRWTIWLLPAAVGVSDTLADGAFALSATGGALGTAAILASLYPAVTVALNVTLLREHLPRVHLLGVLSALVAVACLAR